MSVLQLRVAYGPSEVLKGIDLEFRAGGVTAIIGPSGCGKTTLLNTLNRLSELTPGCRVSGEVRLDERDVLGVDPILLRRQVGMVFQKPNPFPMSIRENVLYGVKAAGLKVDHDQVVDNSLRQAALWEELRSRLDQSATRLSLGQQQRLCLARCLAMSPKVVLMDEPTASLDPSSSARIEASISDLRGQYTIIIVTHNLRQAQRVADRTALLYGGLLVEEGQTQALFDHPQRELTRQYISGELPAMAA
jgi:phosphate transport system ATP-binding protein